MTQTTKPRTVARAPWTRPRLTRLASRDAENSLEGMTPDGQLTFRTGS